MKADRTERSPAEKSHWPMASEREARVGKPAAKRGAGVALASQPARTSDGAGALGAKKLDKADSAETRMGWRAKAAAICFAPFADLLSSETRGRARKKPFGGGRPKPQDREARATEKREAFGRGSKKPLESGFLRESCL